jgi:hypothetical protein
VPASQKLSTKEDAMATQCGVKFRSDGKAVCTVHKDAELAEIGAQEIDIGSGPSPHPYKPTAYSCPVSGQSIPHIKGVPPEH